jgi:hypothetical protein
VVGTVTQQASATVPAGSVIDKDPNAGTSVETGSAVDLVVSTGPAPGVDALYNALRNYVSTLGPGTSLVDKVNRSQAAYAQGNISRACRLLTDLTREAKAQSGKKLSRTQAEKVIADARAIQAAIGCN